MTVACNIRVLAISSLDEETYNTFLELLNGEFNVPIRERSTKIKSALVRFWRNRERLSLRAGQVCYDDRPILKKSDVTNVVKKAFKDTKGSGTRKLFHRLKNVYHGVGERDIRRVLGKSRLHQQLNVRFQNKAVLKPIRARSVQIRHQVDLISMENMPAAWKGKTFKFVLSLMDVFSRYHWLIPLEGKSSKPIATALSEIYIQHGPPKVIQHDQGSEFKGAVKKLCKKLRINVVKGRPYHPQSQGKVERAHRSFRKKLMYDLLTMKNGGANWVKSLQKYAKTLNEEPREELSWKSPFEVYYGRKVNRFDRLSELPVAQEWDQTLEEYERMVAPKPRDYTRRTNDCKRMQQSVASASNKCENRMIRKGLRNTPHLFITLAKKFLFDTPQQRKSVGRAGSSNLLKKWIPVNDITSTTLDKEKRKREVACNRNKRNHRQKYYIPMENDRQLFSSRISNQRLAVRFDPPKDGNCQFSALCHQLTQIGIFRSPKTLREELVEYLRTHPDGADGFPLELFVSLPWDEYLKSMACDGTYGDHLTLQAAANVFQIQIIVFSTLGPSATQIISPVGGDPLCTVSLGHFAEGAGEHYVSLSDLSDGVSQLNDGCQPLEDEESGQDDNESEVQLDEVHLQTEGEELDQRYVPNEKVPGQDSGHEEHMSSQENDQEEHVSSQENGQDKHMSGQEDGQEEHASSQENGQEKHLPSEDNNQGNAQGDSGPFLNCDVLERIVTITLAISPAMRASLRTVSTFFKNIVDKIPLPRVYIPELTGHVLRISVRKIISMKGKGSGAVLELKNIIKSNRWSNAWLLLVSDSLGWFFIKSIYWKK
ncbi:hypothetical protein ACROYT_G034868 [Oculina patagonica]